MSIEDHPTQQIRLDQPATSEPDPVTPAPATSTPADDGSTDVLSLDEIFDRQSTTATPAPPASPTAPATPTRTADSQAVTMPQPVQPVEPAQPVQPPQPVEPVRAAAPATPVPTADPMPPMTPPPATTPAATSGHQRVGAVPAAPVRHSRPPVASRLRGDASAAFRGGLTRTTTWLGTGDNVVIVATLLVALLLFLVVAFA